MSDIILALANELDERVFSDQYGDLCITIEDIRYFLFKNDKTALVLALNKLLQEYEDEHIQSR